MFHFNDDYYLRKHFLKSDTVPTQSLIKAKMKPPLAAVYFKSMNHKLKVIAGLEPPMKGGGGDWYIPPKELLEGRVVLKPVAKANLSKLNYLGIDSMGRNMLALRLKRMRVERDIIVTESDGKWKNFVEMECQRLHGTISVEASKKNTESIQNAFREFTTLYMRSISLIENVLFEAACTQVKKIQNEAWQTMQDKYSLLVKQQAIELYEVYTNKMMTEKSRLKAEFLEQLDFDRAKTTQMLHDRNLEKHIAVEKLRTYLECKNLACQVYVALKERELCMQEMEMSQYEHQKKVKTLKEDIAIKDFEILHQIAKEEKRKEFNQVWFQKIKRVVKKFQIFISYCLRLLPEQADFFINIEKLMLLQLNETIDNPTAESIIVTEDYRYEGPTPEPNPFFLFCDLTDKYKTPIKEDLCPKQCRSASQMPVIIINKRYMYASCDNFQQFTNKIKCYIHGKKGDDADFDDDHIYEHDVPVKYSSSQQLLELKLESSLLKVLQQELANVNEVPIECGECKVPYCFCTTRGPPSLSQPQKVIEEPQSSSFTFGNIETTRSEEVLHRREPTWKSYMEYVEPRKCACEKRVKKHLVENLPVYMRAGSAYVEPEMPNYEKCSMTTLKKMVRVARGYHTPPTPVKTLSKTRDMSTEYSDFYFDYLCDCFSDDEIKELYKDLLKGSTMFDPVKTRQFQVVDSYTSNSHLHTLPGSQLRAHSLRTLLGEPPVLEEIFKNTGRPYD